MTPKDLIDNAVIAIGKTGITPAWKYGKLAYGIQQGDGGPWIYIRYSEKNCTYLMYFLYNLISKKLPLKKRFVPSGCMNCYKVVVRPDSLDDLFKLKTLMEEMDFPSKCGIETRPEVDALYGGYWYCDDLDEGLLRVDQVKYGLLGSGMKSFLKRGCSEYEAEMGPSNTWKIKPGQKAIEKEAESRVAIENFKYDQFNSDKEKIIAEWKEWARELGPVYAGKHDYVTYGEKRE